MPLSPGNKLGPYEILSPLGAGGMGEVYRARDSRLDRDVAVKVMKDRRPGFEKEARAAAARNHPNIVAVYDVGPDYVVMELVEGESLRQVLRRGALSFRDVIEIGAQITEGLAAAHAAHVVHRDLKPENIMVARDGRAKILDFGLAKRTDLRDGDDVTVTEPGAIAGTVGYMSPEQVRGQKLDWRSDIFSLGLVLYEMLTGRRAFAGPSAPEIMTAVVKEPPADFGSGVSAQSQAVVLRCLEKDPERRFQSARDLAFSLRSLGSVRSVDEPSSRSSQPPPIDSLAVMPFENVGGNPDTEYLSDGITESLINSLSRVSNLRVVARSRVFRYKGKEIDPAQVGQDLNVRALLTGRVSQRGDSLRVQAEFGGSRYWKRKCGASDSIAASRTSLKSRRKSPSRLPAICGCGSPAKTSARWLEVIRAVPKRTNFSSGVSCTGNSVPEKALQKPLSASIEPSRLIPNTRWRMRALPNATSCWPSIASSSRECFWRRPWTPRSGQSNLIPRTAAPDRR